MERKNSRPLKTFFAAAAVIAVIVCIGECILLRRVPAASRYYGAYIVFLLISVLAGGFFVYAVEWFVSSAETRTMRLQKVRISERSPMSSKRRSLPSSATRTCCAART